MDKYDLQSIAYNAIESLKNKFAERELTYRSLGKLDDQPYFCCSIYNKDFFLYDDITLLKYGILGGYGWITINGEIISTNFETPKLFTHLSMKERDDLNKGVISLVNEIIISSRLIND